VIWPVIGFCDRLCDRLCELATCPGRRLALYGRGFSSLLTICNRPRRMVTPGKDTCARLY